MAERFYRTLGAFTPEPAPAKTEASVKRAALIYALWAGEVGEVEFAELALELGMEVDEIGQVMSDVREEDGTL